LPNRCLATSSKFLQLLYLQAPTTVGVLPPIRAQVGAWGCPRLLTSTLLLHTASIGAVELSNYLQAMHFTHGTGLIAKLVSAAMP
jgi:hypothetical protein